MFYMAVRLLAAQNKVIVSFDPLPITVATPYITQAPWVTYAGDGSDHFMLHVRAASNRGDSVLKYTWGYDPNFTRPGSVLTYALQGTNAAKDMDCSAAIPGTYHFNVSIIDDLGKSLVVPIEYTILPYDNILITPAAIDLVQGQSVQLSAVARKGSVPVSPVPSFVWSCPDSGSISQLGLFTAGRVPTRLMVSAQGTSGAAFSPVGQAQITIAAVDPTKIRSGITPDGESGSPKPQAAIGAPDATAPTASADPIVYSSGEIELNAVDLSTGGFSPWAISRSYANTRDFGPTAFGGRWYLDQMPFVVDATTHYLVQFSALSTQVFTRSGATNTPLRFEVQSLVAQGTDLIFTDGVGNHWIFYDFTTATVGLRGQLRAYQDAGGNFTEVGYNASNQAITATRFGVDGGIAVNEQFQYQWRPDGLLGGVVRILTRGSTPTTVRQVVYDYYTGAVGDFGAAGQLSSVKVQDGSGVTLETDYYRYWQAGETYLDTLVLPPTAVGQLKYVLSPRAYARLKQNVGDPLTTTVSNAVLASYATKYFEYDANNRVNKQQLRGEGTDATGITTYVYSVNPNAVPQNYNLWTWKTIETLADGTTNTVYGNFAGATLAFATRETAAPNRTWISAYRYDAQGREIWHATPTAVTGITESANDLGLTGAVTTNAPNVLDVTGLIESTVFATTTTATPTVVGDVAGMRKQRRIQQGETGTPQVVDLQTYQLHQGN